MRTKIFHKINEIPKCIIKNYAKSDNRKNIINPLIWIFTETSLSPLVCHATEYEDFVRGILDKGIDFRGALLCWAYKDDIFSADIYHRMLKESCKRNYYQDMIL